MAGILSISLALGGCNKAAEDAGNSSAAALPALPATLPMTDAPAQPMALAPPPAASPARTIRSVRVADHRAAYAYADQAGYFSQSLGDGPPDYGFDYDGVRPWAWQGYDGSRVFLEPVDGGYRYYYYRTGAERPYFVRDPQFAYGYDGGRLAAVYGPDGALIPYDDYGPRLGYAAAYLWRAERLFEASRDRQAISAVAWADRRDAIAAYRERWAANRERQADWAAYHAEEVAQESRYWAEEAARRDADAQRFAAWHRQDFRTPPPPRAIPAGWQQADWARDGARYAPIAAVAVGAGALAAVAHHQRPATGEYEAARQQGFAAPPSPQPMAAAPHAVRGGREGRSDPIVRPPEQVPRAAGAALSPPSRTAFAEDRRSAPLRPYDGKRQPPVGPVPAARNDAAPSRREDAPGRPTMRPEREIAVAPERNGARDHSPPPKSHVEARRDVTAHVATESAVPRRSPEAPRAPAPPPRVAQAAPRHGGGDRQGGGQPNDNHIGGGHPGGAHSGGNEHGEHHR